MNRTSAVTLFCRNNCITFVRFRLIGEFMDFSSQILHFVFLHYAIQAEKARFRVTAAVTPLQKYFLFSRRLHARPLRTTVKHPDRAAIIAFIRLYFPACRRIFVLLLSDGCLHLFGEKLKERVFSLNRFPWGDSSCHPVCFRTCPENVAHSPKTKKAAGDASVWKRLRPLR